MKEYQLRTKNIRIQQALSSKKTVDAVNFNF